MLSIHAHQHEAFERARRNSNETRTGLNMMNVCIHFSVKNEFLRNQKKNEPQGRELAKILQMTDVKWYELYFDE